MSILIKGMEMPRSCAECYVAWERCHRTVEWYKNNPQYYDIRHEDCPLVPVPPHGRLIDADALNRKIYFEIPFKVFENVGRVSDMILLVCEAPTIIPAEEGDTWMYEIQKRLEDLERRGVGFIDVSYNGGIDYKIDGVVYHICIEEGER